MRHGLGAGLLASCGAGGYSQRMKGVIVAAGYGKRFLPATKTVPKELLPLIDRPAIEFVIEEFLGAGIREILIISSRRKQALEDYFDREVELESVFRAEGAQAKLEAIQPPNAEIQFVRQRKMMGTGHALLFAESFVGDSPFVVAYPDDLQRGGTPVAKLLVDAYTASGCSVLATMHDPPNLERYGVLSLAADGVHVDGIVEKPAPGSEPSREASLGRYLYTPELFPLLREGWDAHLAAAGASAEERALPPAACAVEGLPEYFHTYALNKLMQAGKVVFARIDGERLDTGSPAGYLRAILRYAAGRPDLVGVLREELERLR